MAIDILSIPAMSAEPERVFSGSRRTVSWDRAQLGAETLEPSRFGVADIHSPQGGEAPSMASQTVLATSEVIPSRVVRALEGEGMGLSHLEVVARGAVVAPASQ
jgi:hypothetical protein